MVYELVLATVDPAKRDEYVGVFRKAFRGANFAGAREGKILRSVEDPSRVAIVIEWDTVEAHTQHRGTDAHNNFRAQIQGYQTAPSQTSHFIIEDL
jgi:heme-degrading monooxygenase HmoA